MSENFPVDYIIISDSMDNRTRLKFMKMFYFEEQGYVAASIDSGTYNLFKVIESSEGTSELHDIKDDDEWKRVNSFLQTHYKDALE